jgi:hypothetical protein
VVAGDLYDALDCREDDDAWCNSSPDGPLIPAIHFEQLRESLDDYRHSEFSPIGVFTIGLALKRVAVEDLVEVIRRIDQQ